MSVATPYTVGVVLSTRPWPTRLHSYVADHVPDCRVVVVRDERAALESGAHVLLVDETTPWLTARFVERAELLRIRVVGVYDRSDGGVGRARLSGLGLSHLVEGSAAPDDLVFLLDRLRPSGDGANGTVPPTRLADVARHTDMDTAPGGLIVATGGPSGSGARELAVGLATRWALEGCSTVLVDLNETTPGVARRLGVPLFPHVLAAVERLRLDGPASIRTSVADQAPGRPFDVLPGLPRVREWDRIQAADAEQLLLACAASWDRVVVTTSPIVEDMRRWVDRFGVSRRVLGIADVVVGCVGPTPRGLVRYLEWLAEVSTLCPSTVVVLNRLTRNSRITGQVRELIVEAAGDAVEGIVEVPFDSTVERAEWDGTLVTRGRYAKAVARLAAMVDELVVEPTVDRVGVP